MKSTFIYSFVFLFCITKLAAQQPGLCFNLYNNTNTLTTGSSPRAVISADFNSDSRMDMAVTDRLANTVSIFIGLPGGGFAPPVSYTTGVSPQSLASADLNGDGRPDLAVANYSASSVSVLFGSASGTFAAAVNYNVGQNPVAVSTGDFNGDGRQDIAIANSVSSSISLLLGTPSGTFTAGLMSSLSAAPSCIAAADFNGDGRSDVSVTIPSQSKIMVLFGTTGGGFTGITNYTFASTPESLCTRDFNGDGRSDLAVARSNSQDVVVLFGSATGTFALSGTYPVGTAKFITAGDVNADGRADLVVTNSGPKSISVLLGSASGTFAAAMNYQTDYAVSAAIGDFTGDNKADLALVINLSPGISDNVSIITGNGNGTFIAGSALDTGSFPTAMTTADFNNDNIMDLAVANGHISYSLGFAILSGTGGGSFAPPVVYPLSSVPYSIISADFNGDNFKDLAVMTNSISIYLGNGTGTFGAPSYTYPATGVSKSAIARDFNNDGSIDLALSNENSPQLTVLLNNGNGSFVTQPLYNLGFGAHSYVIASTDFNEDNLPDIAVATNGAVSQVALLYGTTAGSFVVGGISVAGGYCDLVSTGDYNGDGHADLAACIRGNGMVYILHGRGNGSFAPAVTYTGVSNTCMTSGDYNGDGVSDIALAGNAFNFLLGSVTGTMTSVFINYNDASDIVSSDLNGDGRTDIAIVNSGFFVSLMINGTPTLTLSAANAICAGNSVSVSVSGASSYTWSTGAHTASIAVSPAATSIYTVTGSTEFGCSNTAVKTVTVNPVPTLSVNSGAICTGQSFTMVPAGAATYTFSNGSAVVNPSAGNSYSVTGTSSAGCVATLAAVSHVTVNALPVISVNSGSVCIGQNFTLVPQGASTYTVSGGSVVVNPTANATYTVAGTSTAGCVSAPAIASITARALPPVSVNSGAVCAGQSFTVSASGAASYTISGGSFTVSPAANAAYTVSGTDLYGCIGNAQSNVTVNPLPVISAGNGDICAGQSYTLNPTGAFTYTYSGGSQVVSPALTTSYSITGSSAQGCVSSSAAIASVIVHALPVIAVNSGTSCSGSSFTISPTGALIYTISGGQAIVSPIANTNYTVSGTSAEGCNSAVPAISHVTVVALPAVSGTSSHSTICTGESAILSAGGATTYTWSSGASGYSVMVNPLVTVSYTVSGTDANGCSNRAVVTQNVDLCTAMRQQGIDTHLVVYPNPNAGEFIIETGEVLTIKISDAMGRLICTMELSEGKNKVDLGSYAAGIYIIQAAGKQKPDIIKLVKQ